MGRLRRLEKAVFHDSYSIVSEETVLRSPSQRLDKLVCRRGDRATNVFARLSSAHFQIGPSVGDFENGV